MQKTLAVILWGATVLAQAQAGGKLRQLLNGDSLAPPDHDTAYISTYRSNLVISAVSNYAMADVDIEQNKGKDMGFSANNTARYGLGLDYKWLGVEATFNIPAWSSYDASLGKTTSRGFGLGYTGRRAWGRAFVNTTKGYYLNNPEAWTGTPDPVVRPDLSSRTWLLSVNYALSGKRRFSQKAALTQMERQKKSAGTFVAGLSAWITDIGADSSLLRPALVDSLHLASGFSGLHRWLAGAIFGYAHTFVFWHKGYIHAALVPGLTFVKQEITTPAGQLRGSGVAGVTEMRLGAGFNGNRWYLALTTSYFYSTTPIAEQLNLGTNYGFVRLALGIRLGDPGIKALGAVGL